MMITFSNDYIYIFTASNATGPPHGSRAGKRIRSVQGPPWTPELFGPKLEQTEHSIPYGGITPASIFSGQKFRMLLMEAWLCLIKHLSHINLLRQNFFSLFLLLFLALDNPSVVL